MKFLIDQNLPAKLAVWISEKGHEAVHVREIGLRVARDDEIVREAIRLNAIVITKDSDFQVRSGVQVVWVRVGNSTTPTLFACLDRAWKQIETALDEGDALVEVFDDR